MAKQFADHHSIICAVGNIQLSPQIVILRVEAVAGHVAGQRPQRQRLPLRVLLCCVIKLQPLCFHLPTSCGFGKQRSSCSVYHKTPHGCLCGFGKELEAGWLPCLAMVYIMPYHGSMTFSFRHFIHSLYEVQDYSVFTTTPTKKHITARPART